MSNRALISNHKIILEHLAKSNLHDKFYWTGGTALTYFYLNHRLSNDIDLFSDQKFGYEEIIPFVKDIAKSLDIKDIDEHRIYDRWDFTLVSKKNEKTRLEFVYYGFPKLEPRKMWTGIMVDSLIDMSANKTMAMIDRTDPKDAFDIFYILKKKYYSPEKLLKLVKQKFSVNFSLSTFWSAALTDVKNLNNLSPLLLGTKIQKQKKISEIINYYEQQSAQLLKKYLD